MAAGGYFRLMANDGRLDRLLCATELLQQRIVDIKCVRAERGDDDVNPTLADIERTHILFVNASFKPFAATTFEYQKVTPSAGSVTSIGSSRSSVQFSIPQFGEFFSDIVVHVTFASLANTGLTQKTTVLAATSASDNYAASSGDVLVNITDAFGTVIDDSGGVQTYYNLLRYCEYPGEKLLANVKFEVNGNPLDEYDDVTAAMIRKFHLPSNKEVGYKRLVGQEVELEGTGALRQGPVWDPEVIPSGTIQGAPNSSNSTYRASKKALWGAQTPRATQPSLDIWDPLQFWFTRDPRQSIASVSIPHGQRFITIDLAANSELIEEFPNLFVRRLDESAATPGASGVATTGVVAGATYCVYRSNSTTHNTTTGLSAYTEWGSTLPSITISKLEMYINNLFLLPDIHDIYIQRIGFSLVRVFRRHKVAVNQSGEDEKQLSQLKWAAEYLYLGIRPQWNTKATNRERMRDWHRFALQQEIIAPELSVTGAVSVTALNAINGGSTVSSMDFPVPITYAVPLKTIDSLSITAHGITIYDNMNSIFFNAYMPYTFGGSNVVTPDDEGALFVNFSLFPRSYQPSGHLNISRAREFFAKWNSSYLGSRSWAGSTYSNMSGDLYAIATCINFLVVSDGSASLRYST